MKLLNEYLFEPIQECLIDVDPYVRKSAILCIGKIYQINPEKIDESAIFSILTESLLTESNPNVLSVIFYTLMDISQIKGEPVFTIN